MLACSAAAARSLRRRGLLAAQGGLKGRLAALASCASCTTGELTAWAGMTHASLLSANILLRTATINMLGGPNCKAVYSSIERPGSLSWAGA